MEPVFTLQWPEYLLSQELSRFFPKSKHYSVLVPASRQEKGIDLALVRKRPDSKSAVALLQVKASRTYPHAAPKRESTIRFRFGTWFNRFDPSPDADFFLLFCMYPRDPARTKSVNAGWYRHWTLLFTLAEMQHLMSSCRTIGGAPDRMFGFDFDTEAKIVLTRGDQDRQHRDYADHVLDKRVGLLTSFLDT
jgi:hypothetical protein